MGNKHPSTCISHIIELCELSILDDAEQNTKTDVTLGNTELNS